MIILEKHPVSGYEPRHYRREPDDVLTRRVDVDIDMDAGRRVIRVERAVVRAGGGFVVGPPKSDAGRRTVAIPPHLVGVIAEHLAGHVGYGPDALLFPADHVATWPRPRSTGASTPRVRLPGVADPTLPRSAALRGCAGGLYGCHDRRADGPPRSLDPGGRDAPISTPPADVTR